VFELATTFAGRNMMTDARDLGLLTLRVGVGGTLIAHWSLGAASVA